MQADRQAKIEACLAVKQQFPATMKPSSAQTARPTSSFTVSSHYLQV